MPKKRVKSNKKNDRILFTFLATFLSIIGFIIALIAKRENRYVMFYAKQSLILFLAGIAAKILTLLLAITVVGLLAVPFVWIIYVVLFIIALVNSLSGKEKETPIVGKYAGKIKL